ncbi:DUF4253 domain-containing protein [Prochlorothrix hollandica]|uniref:DUF4253 domain-containing protein n=1 Tax=Prochlorothrix hollandica TaxID=1223 RepID=UPI0033413A5D
MELSQALDQIRACGTNGLNYDVDTEAIVARLLNWSQRFKFDVVEVDSATVILKLESLPENLPEFCQEVYEFCPDTLEQGYDCLPDLLELAQDSGEAIDPALLDLLQDLDPTADDFGLRAMEKDLPRTMALTLWWD